MNYTGLASNGRVLFRDSLVSYDLKPPILRNPIRRTRSGPGTGTVPKEPNLDYLLVGSDR